MVGLKQPEIWWDSTVDAIRQCLDHYKKTTEQIASIGFSGQMHGIIPIDKNNAPLYNCIMYMILDLRAF